MVSLLGGRIVVGGNVCLDKPGDPKDVRGDAGSCSSRVFRTGVFDGASG